VVALVACGGAASAPSAANPYPATGIVLLSLKDGARVTAATVGSDPVAVIVSDDGKTAYLADSAPGDVYAVHLPGLTTAWKQHVGGAPFGLLLHGGRLYVSLFDGAAVDELDPATGDRLAGHPVPQGPAVMTVDVEGRVVVAGTSGRVDRLDGTWLPAGNGFGIALAGGTLWTADYERAELVPVATGNRVGLPLPVFPFWLAPGSNGTLLIAAEGPTEDTDLGGVFSYDAMSNTFKTLARPRDPDQVVQSGSTVLVAAHGDREVLAIDGDHTSVWAPGAAAVGLAPDPALGLLAVVVNAHE
jgi:DNA-binding beta-propeller fold protein YncE